MVAQLLRLKARLLANGFRRSPWQLVGVILGGLYGLFIAATLIAGMYYLGTQPDELVRAVLVIFVAVLVLGWALLPVILTGIDLTLDPSRFATFTVPPKQLVIGLLLGGFIGVPGLVTLILLSSQAVAWRQDPAAAAVAILCGALTAVLCLVLARLTTTAATALTANRRFREIGTVLLFVPLLLLGPILGSVQNGFEEALSWLPAAADVLAWTPLGSFTAVPADVAAGAWGIAAARFLVSAGYLAAAVWVWKNALVRALETPPRASDGGKGAEGLGALRWFPPTPWGAVAGRCLTYWLRDPRYAASIVVVPLMPVLFWYWGAQSGDYTAMLFIAPLIAVLMGFSISADVSYDNTAFSLHAVAGIRGFHDRLGRALACAVLAVPVVLLSAILPPLILGRAELMPGVLGLSFGALMTGLGVSSITSARFTYSVPLPGESPFKTPPGAGMRMMVVQLATFGVMGLLLLPELGLMLAQLVTGNDAFGWAALAAGLVLGSVLLVAGLRVGGRWFDARVPELMQATVLNR